MTRVPVLTAAVCLLVVAVLLGFPGSALAQSDGGPADGTVETLPTGTEDPCADLRPWEKPACQVREGIQDGVGNIVDAGLSSVFDQLYEWVASGATWLLSQLVSLMDSSSRPEVGVDWFARQYRLMGGLAVALVMPLLMIATLVAVVRQDWRGLLRSYFVYLPAAMVGTAVAIPLVDMGVSITDWMSLLFLDGLRGDIEGFTAEVTDTLSGTVGVAGAAPGVAPFLMFMGAAVIALGAFAVWVELVLRAAGIYVALFFLPLGFAALVWPSTRKWFGRLVKALAALILAKFVIVAVIALAAGALGNLGADDGSGFGGVIAGSALMLMAAFSPLVLFRLADVAGDEMATAIGGVTQHRTSPVPTPSPQQSASKMYGRIMSGRVAKDGVGLAGSRTAGAGTAGAAAATGGATAVVGGVAAATGGAAAVAGGVATTVAAPHSAAESLSRRMGDAAGAAASREGGSTSNGRGEAPASTAVGEGGERAAAAAAARPSDDAGRPGPSRSAGVPRTASETGRLGGRDATQGADRPRPASPAPQATPRSTPQPPRLPPPDQPSPE